MGYIARICCIMGILTTIIFYIWKFKNRKFIFSPFNISVLISAFSTLIMPFFFTNDKAWIALGVTSAQGMSDYLSKNILINVIGYLIFILTAVHVESQNKSVHFHINVSETFERNIDFKILILLFWITAVAWIGIVFAFNHGIPLLNGGRTFYINTAISPVYLLLNEFLFLFSVIFGIQWITHKKYGVEFLITVIMLIGTGNRGTVLLSSVYPIGVLWFYYSEQRKSKNTSKKLGKVTWKIIWLGIVICAAGMVMLILRNGFEMNLNSIFYEVTYGNTFSDIRDGAFILKGWKKSGLGYLGGKTYLAALLSFVPGSILKFKRVWYWGYFSTNKLFGWKNHPGLRGGNVLEAYLNFGWIGVVIAAIIQGYTAAYIENLFSKKCIKTSDGFHIGEILMIMFLQKIQSFFICTAGNYTLFVFIGFVGLCALLSAWVKKSKVIHIIYHR